MKLFAAAAVAVLMAATPAQAGFWSWFNDNPTYPKARYEADRAAEKAAHEAYEARVRQQIADGTDPMLHAGEPLSDGALEMRLWKLETGFYDHHPD